MKETLKVYEIASSINCNSSKIISVSKELNIEITNIRSEINTNDIEKIKTYIEKNTRDEEETFKSNIKILFSQMTSLKDFVELLNLVGNEIQKGKVDLIELKKLTFYAFHSKHKYKTFYIKKKTGGNREIHAPIKRLKKILKSLNYIFQCIYTPHEDAHGFSQKKTIISNAKKHINKNYVFNIDLKNFFPNIKQARIWRRLQLEPFNLNGEDKIKIVNLIANLVCYQNEVNNNFLAQGFPTSPILSNAIAEKLDMKLRRLAKKYNVKYSRCLIEFAKNNPIKLNEDSFKELFLNKINITIPKENLSKHSISNEWAIYKWSKALSIDSNVHLDFLEEHVKTSLYFKYLDNLHNLEINNLKEVDYKFTFESSCNILYIDDESEKGWGTIMSKIFSPINFEYLGKDFKDKTSEEIVLIALEKISSFQPEIIILDLRLCDDDFRENRSVEELTGTVILNKIKEINPGIQCIIFSATSKSVILNHLFNIGILGFIKKDGPDESYLSIEQNIINFHQLINEGIRKKFLIVVFNTIKYIESKFKHIDKKDLDSSKIELLRNNLYMAFEILNGNNDNHLNYGMLTIFKCLEIIKDSLTIVEEKGKSINEIFIYTKENHTASNEYSQRGRNVKDKSSAEKIQIYKSSRNRLKIALIEYLAFGEEDRAIQQLDEIVDKRNDFIHPENEFEDVTTDEIIRWIKLLSAIINKLSSMK